MRFSIRIKHVALSAALVTWAAFFAATAVAQSRATYTNPVLAGDYPDPSIIRVGQDYWATATTSHWAPLFPLLHSRDLVNWQAVGAAMQKRPDWSDGNYWAPEISYYRGRYFIYYTGHKKGGSLCVAVMTATNPRGPYTDHGPLVCQDAGSIDAMAVTDENGRRYLVWKEDGNSRNQPTPIWAQPLSSDGTKLIGGRRELIRNTAAWESNLVEGPFILRRGGYFYMFYSGNACCGRGCNYAMGVARSRALLGPWEKNPANPILKGNDEWKCPGHGSIVSDARGRDFLIYHAYHPKDFVYAGRQALLDEVKWGADGWPTINAGKGPSARAASPFGDVGNNAEYNVFDDFTSPRLQPGWQWPQANEPLKRTQGARLILAPTAAHAQDMLGAVLARTTTEGDYVATAIVDKRGLKPGTRAGLAAYGDEENALGVAVGGGRVTVWRREKGTDRTLATKDEPRGTSVYLRMTAKGGDRFRFAVSGDGRSWTEVGEAMNGEYLPPWDRAVRVALTVGGATGAAAKFESFRISSIRTPRSGFHRYFQRTSISPRFTDEAKGE
ncbi:MAG TPA: family 43 glycosylhydrolase [Blastocatellia bacterium]|nr:family 43 glycosylhydrolase [Blastocatellia bacterium]